MKLATWFPSLQLLLLLNTLSMCFCEWARLDKLAFEDLGAQRTTQHVGFKASISELHTLKRLAPGIRILSFLSPRSEVYTDTSPSCSPAHSIRRFPAGRFTTGLHLVNSTRVFSQGVQLSTDHDASTTLSEAQKEASATQDAASVAKGDTVPFTAGLGDIVLPPKSSASPPVDTTLCRSDFPSATACGLSTRAPSDRRGTDANETFRAVPSGGPVSFFDGRTDLHPALAGASDDAFFIDFYGPLQLGAAEVAQSALSAAKRFVRTRVLKRQDGKRLENDGNERQGRSDAGKLKDLPHSNSLLIGSTDLAALLTEDRFRTAPYWLVERVAYALRRLRPSSFGFVVAQMLEALCRLSEAERDLGITIDSFVSLRTRTYTKKLQWMSSIERALHLTGGNPRALKDVLKFRRGYPVFPWGLSIDPQTTRRFMRYNLLVSEETLTQHFFAARRDSEEGWTAASRYRVHEKHVPLDGHARLMYEGFNSAAIACIEHVAAGWQRPVYIISMLERARSLRQLLKAMGLTQEASKRVHVCGLDGILMGTDSDNQRPRALPPGVCARQPPDSHTEAILRRSGRLHTGSRPRVSMTDPSCASESATDTSTVEAPGVFGTPAASSQASSISAKLNGALALWQYHKTLGFNGVPHFIDDDIHALEKASTDPRMERWRLYFCDWGFSTFDEKLRAVISDRVKIIPTMSRLADLLLTPSFLAPRLWAFGSTAAPAEWLEEGRMCRWLRLCGSMQEAQ